MGLISQGVPFGVVMLLGSWWLNAGVCCNDSVPGKVSASQELHPEMLDGGTSCSGVLSVVGQLVLTCQRDSSRLE
ncbi:hypothetical protein PF005_g18756 [Phytophthora fragariae]|uniref:Uncharacterized protein n=1 Tax=Phytophthora fragariae TaxID=53985 RepID=A0A6A3X2Q9_9STRA|nr:hypothetical protein PF003_g15890 [Phytophthora fragariae]KAE8936594.1 hypothetical protein PF009_g13487 [Phytophthora fragariae]KAE8992165.1 hypothetical protein PF011_g17650 [Phytophthora fragariae]KAE9086472.1 hypothetical protein PF007_g20764 [Phytophthora fragariae]KAE9091548.1 hypothetical protein PF010_g18146 [Phytophthora fragariae]